MSAVNRFPGKTAGCRLLAAGCLLLPGVLFGRPTKPAKAPPSLFYEPQTGVEIPFSEGYRRTGNGGIDIGGAFLFGNELMGPLFRLPLTLSAYRAHSLPEWVRAVRQGEGGRLSLSSPSPLIGSEWKLISVAESPVDSAVFFQFYRPKQGHELFPHRCGLVVKAVDAWYVTAAFEGEEAAYIAGEQWMLRFIETALAPKPGLITRFEPLFPYLTTSLTTLLPHHPYYQLFPYQEGMGTSALFYRLEDGDSTVYLMASVHAGLPSFYPLPFQLLSAFESCPNLVFEAVPEGNTLWEIRNYHASLEKYQTGSDLLSFISRERFEEINQFLTSRIFKLPTEQLLHLKPWVLYTFASSLLSKESGIEAQYGMENHFLSIKKPSQTVKGLEAVKAHLAVLDRIAPDYWIGELLLLDRQETFEEMMETMEQWRAGNRDFFAATVEKERRTKDPSYFAIMLRERNGVMAEAVERYLRESEDYFILAGTAHFCGPDNLISLLESKGLRPVRVENYSQIGHFQ